MPTCCSGHGTITALPIRLSLIFTLMMDHAPLQWLLAQKMEGLLTHWPLAMQEYNYSIVYRTGSSNSNADALLQYSKHHQINSSCYHLCTSNGTKFGVISK